MLAVFRDGFAAVTTAGRDEVGCLELARRPCPF
jgi:hypothetical protein